MKKLNIYTITLITLVFFAFQNQHCKFKHEPQTVVQIKKEKGKYQLYKNGEPFFIKGAGGYKYYDRLKECGGNSIRIWSISGAREAMDKAHALGLTVTLGLDIERERLGFDYSDKKAVAEQFERVKKDILDFKDHPALLMWAIGNEAEQFGTNYKLWNAVQDIAKYIHEVDPNHPTTTMLAGIPRRHIREISKRCPDLDALSINAYRWLAPVKNDITECGWRGPYLIGEWGASGYWESDTVPWGAPLEQTSTEKIQACAERYHTCILANADRCLGAYVFYWGTKQARTHTLLSLFLENGEEIGMQDMLQKAWTGKAPANKAPEILPVGIDNLPIHKGVILKPASKHMAFTDAKDPDQDHLYYYWEIYPESFEKKTGGDMEMTPQVIEGLIMEGQRSKQLSFVAPEKEGPYRLFAYVYDGHNHVATANAPFYVKN
jgi:hypothetical protein